MTDGPETSRRAWVIALAGALAGAAVLAYRQLSDFDLPWHLAFGRLVVERRALVGIDELSFTARPIRHADYVSDVVLYGIAHGAGPLGLQVLGGVLGLAIAFLLWRRSRSGGPLGFAVIALAMAATQPWLLVRPATVSFVLLAWVMVVLDEHRRSGGGRAERMRLHALAPLFALWANVHGFVVLGLVLVVGYAAYAGVCRLARGKLGALAPEGEGNEAARVGLVAVACLLATMCNRAGPLLLTAPFQIARDKGRIAEWAAPSFAFMAGVAPLVSVLGVATLAALALGREGGPNTGSKTPSLFDLGMVVLALALGSTAVRLLPVAMVLVVPIAARRLAARLPKCSSFEVACSLSTWLVAPWIWSQSPAPRGVGFDPTHFSEGAIEFIVGARPTGRMYNSLPIGGWLEWRLFPLYRTLIDGRQSWVHDPDLVTLYHASETEPAALQNIADRFDLQWAVVFAAEGEPLGASVARSPAWAMVYWDDAAAVYVKTDGPNLPLARRGYRLMRHPTDPGDVLASSIRRDGVAMELAHDGELAAAQAPSSPRAVFLGGCAAIARRDKEGLEAALANLARLAPGHRGIDFLEQGWVAAEARTAHP
jgi:hypothetical protein